MVDEPIRIGTLELKNRLAMAPVAVYKATEEGKITPEACAHYQQRAQRSGVGLIITEHLFIAPEGQAKPCQISISRESDTIGLSALADACHNNGVAAFAQISHAGGAARKSVTGLDPVAPTAMVSSQAWVAKEGDGIPRELDAEGIARIVAAFADAARRACEAGFDGVEIHSAHAYLLNEFYSPLHNKRTDEYGGTLEGRLRIHREVLAAVRAAVSDEFVVGMRLGGCDYEEGGATIEDAVEAARILAASGVDYLNLSGGWHAWRRAGHEEPGWFADQSRAVKAVVDTPILLAGGIQTPEQADVLLANGACDIVGIGRPLLKNPAWPEA